MKTYTKLFERIYCFENLFNAYEKARRNKRYKMDALAFRENLESNLIELKNELIYKQYTPGSYREFYVYDPKIRLIMAAPFRDRVVHHALCNVIEPIFESRFIYHSYACRVGKGTHAGVDCTSEYLKETRRKYGEMYCLKGDVRKYFLSVSHNILRRILRKKIQCRETLWLMDKIIASTAQPGDMNPRGIPVGNLTSQLFANIYLNELDYFMKQEKKNKYYVRYMDDFLILHPDKAYLHKLWNKTELFLNEHLDLKLNQKTAVFPVSQGIDFLGYRIWENRRVLRKTSVKRIKRIMKKYTREYQAGNLSNKKIRPVLCSWIGHAEHADVPQLRNKIIEQAREVFGLGL